MRIIEQIILSLALLSGSAMAANSNLKLTEKTTALKISVVTEFAVNCPHTLNLDFQVDSARNQITINTDQSVSDYMNFVKKSVTDSCQDEIRQLELDRLNGPVCLSIGFEHGTVFVDTGSFKKNKTVKIVLPRGFKVESVEQLSSALSSDSDGVDCDVPPPSIACCQAEIPSCISCRENSRRIRAEWEALCN